ncbi:MAG: hypothetical protein QXN05_04155 [Acidilobaceae archaeon]
MLELESRITLPPSGWGISCIIQDSGRIASIDAGVYHSCVEKAVQSCPLTRVLPDIHIQASINPLYAPLFLLASKGEISRCVLATPLASLECKSFLIKALAFLSLASPHVLDMTLKSLVERCSSISLASAGSSISFSKILLSVLWPPPSELLGEFCKRVETFLNKVLERFLGKNECREDYKNREETVAKFFEQIAEKSRPLGALDEQWRYSSVERLNQLFLESSEVDIIDITSFMPKPVLSLKGVFGELLNIVNSLTSLSILVEPLSDAYVEIEIRRDFQKYSQLSIYKPLRVNRKSPVLLILGPLGPKVTDAVLSKMVETGVKRVLVLTAPLHGCIWTSDIARLKPIVVAVGKCKMHSFIKDAKSMTRYYRVSSREVAVGSHNTQVLLSLF